MIDMAHLVYLSRDQDNDRHLTCVLQDPFHRFSAASDRSAFSNTLKAFCANTATRPALQDFMRLRLITEYLLHRAKVPDWFGPWLRHAMERARHCPELPWEDMEAGSWQAVPVVLVWGDAYLRWFVVGKVPQGHPNRLLPAWAEPLLDPTAAEAVRRAAAAARGRFPCSRENLYCYPLAVVSGSGRFQGPSLALPLALGFLRLLAGQPQARSIAASGALEQDGTVLGVGHLSRKMECARRHRFKAFLFPAAHPGPDPLPDMETLPVSTLDEAFLVQSLYSPGKARDLLLFYRMLESPGLLTSTLRQADPAWLHWAVRRQLVRPAMGQVLRSPERTGELVAALKACVETRNASLGKAVCALVTDDDLPSMRMCSPSDAFQWCTLNLALANQKGDVVHAKAWEKRASDLVEGARAEEYDIYADHCNHCLLLLHNLYLFDPKLPDFVNGAMRCLQAGYALKRRHGTSVSRALGALCGTVGQNFGFCGPVHLEEALSHWRKAQEAFGGGSVPRYRKDWQRQYNHMLYAYLDARRFDDAQVVLGRYLDIETWDGVERKSCGWTQWQHAALARFLAETALGEPAGRYVEQSLLSPPHRGKDDHPWQLWCFNMGRIMETTGRGDEALAYYRESLSRCLHPGRGPAVKVMALLPLGALWAMGALDDGTLCPVEKAIREAAGLLHEAHFEPLLCGYFLKEVLARVRSAPERVFPFTYR